VGGGFEPPHLSLALAGRLMRDFGSIVFVLLSAVNNTRHHDAVGRRIAAKLVRDQTPWRTALPFQQLTEEAFGGTQIAPSLWRPWMFTNNSLKEGLVYADPGADAYDAQHRTQVLRRLRQRAANLGFGLIDLSTR
jgi:hypothetical protein